MKKRYFAFTLIIMLFSKASVAQVDAVAYSKGSSNISEGYGFFNVWKEVLLAFGQKTTATGPLIFTYEYGITKKISGGISIGYSEVANKYYLNPANIITQKFTDLSIGGRASYHFGKYKKFDPYVGGGFGYYKFRYVNNQGSNIPFTIPDPFAISLELGAKYYLYHRLGIYGEAGYVDGAIIKIGLTYKTK